MKLGILLLIFGFVELLINCQTLIDDKFSPFLKLTRLFMSNKVKPRSFEVGYRINLKNNVSVEVVNFKDVSHFKKFAESPRLSESIFLLWRKRTGAEKSSRPHVGPSAYAWRYWHSRCHGRFADSSQRSLRHWWLANNAWRSRSVMVDWGKR